MRRVNRFWRRSADAELRERFKSLDNDSYRALNNPACQAIFKKHQITLNWQMNFISAHQRITRSFTAEQQLPDYLLIKSCRVENIDHLLRCNDGHRRVFVADSDNRDIFYFLRTVSPEERQVILDRIFNALAGHCRNEEGEWRFDNLYEYAEFERKYGKSLANLIKINSTLNAVPLPIVFAAICNQVELLQSWYKQRPDLESTRFFVCSIAIVLNYETMFDFSKELEQSFHGLVYNGLNAALQRYKSISLSPVFSKQCFDSLKQVFGADRTLWPDTPLNQLDDISFIATDIIEPIQTIPPVSPPLFVWAIILNQDLFKGKEVRLSNPTLLSERGEISHRWLLNYACQHSHQVLLSLLSKGAVLPLNIDAREDFDDLKNLVSPSNPIHPLRVLVEANDLVRVDSICSQHNTDQTLMQYMLGLAAATGNVNCFDLVLRHGARIDKDTIGIAMFNHQFVTLDAILLHDKSNRQLFTITNTFSRDLRFEAYSWLINNKLHLLQVEQFEQEGSGENQLLGEIILKKLMRQTFVGVYTQSDINEFRRSMKLLVLNGIPIDCLRYAGFDDIETVTQKIMDTSVKPVFRLSP